MRIAFFHAYPHHFAGSQRLTAAIATDLLSRGHDVRVFLPSSGMFEDELIRRSVPVTVVPAPVVWRQYGRALEGRLAVPALALLPAYWLRLWRAFRRWRPDVIHCNDHRGILLGGPPSRLVGRPVVWHVHGQYDSCALSLFAGAFASRILVVSEAMRRAQRGLARFAEKTEVLHNGLVGGTDLLQATSRPVQPPVVLTGARIHPDKGLDVLLRAAAIVWKSFPDVRFHIAGDTQPGYEGYRRQLEELRAALGVDGVVTFLGSVDNPGEAWAGATVYVQPSRREPFGLATLEAMALGIPVVASAADGLTEVVEAGETALVVEPGDPVSLAVAIEQLLESPHRREQLGRAGRTRVERLFTGERMVDRLVEIYAALTRRTMVSA
jgi:hypothetical protein